MANTSQLQEINLSSGNLADIAWSAITFSVTFIVYAFFWILYILSTIVLVGPALQTMFNVPGALANWLMVGVWALWMVAYTQIKRGGLGWDQYR